MRIYGFKQKFAITQSKAMVSRQTCQENKPRKTRKKNQELMSAEIT